MKQLQQSQLKFGSHTVLIHVMFVQMQSISLRPEENVSPKDQEGEAMTARFGPVQLQII